MTGKVHFTEFTKSTSSCAVLPLLSFGEMTLRLYGAFNIQLQPK